ncbi:hypothetical protein Mapa_007902 [Marchantia paleacea]|nr:hypothetical protein Mapa_007902 [Marchantia paleacea]
MPKELYEDFVKQANGYDECVRKGDLINFAKENGNGPELVYDNVFRKTGERVRAHDHITLNSERVRRIEYRDCMTQNCETFGSGGENSPLEKLDIYIFCNTLNPSEYSDGHINIISTTCRWWYF